MAILRFRQKRLRLCCSPLFLGWQRRAVRTTLAFLDVLHPPHSPLRKVFLLAALILFPVFVDGGDGGVTRLHFCTHRSISGPPRGPHSSMVYPMGIQR